MPQIRILSLGPYRVFIRDLTLVSTLFSLIRPFPAATKDLLFPNGVEEKIGLWYDAVDCLKEKP